MIERRRVLEKVIKKIPPLPEVVVKILLIVEKGDVPSERIAEEIERDPVLAADVLRIANSEIFPEVEVDSLHKAVVILGTRAISRIAISSWAKRVLFIELEGYNHARRELSLFSLSGAFAAKRVAELSKVKELLGWRDVIFTSALLRNIGKIALDFLVRSSKSKLLEKIWEGKTFYTAEKEIMGLPYPEAGFLIAKHLKLPEDVSIPIKYFKDPEKFPDRIKSYPKILKKITYTIHVGDAVAQMLGVGCGVDNLLYKFSEKSMDELGINEDTIVKVLEEVAKKIYTIENEILSFEEDGRRKR